MLPDIAIRNLRQAAWILRGTELWNDRDAAELKRMAARIEAIAERVENREIDEPAAAVG